MKRLYGIILCIVHIHASSINALAASENLLEIVKEYPADSVTIYSDPRGVLTFSLHLETDREGHLMAHVQEADYYLATSYAHVAKRDLASFMEKLKKCSLENLEEYEQKALANIIAYKNDYQDYLKSMEFAESLNDPEAKLRWQGRQYGAKTRLMFQEASPDSRPNPLILMTVRNLIEQHKMNKEIEKESALEEHAE